MRDFVKPDIAGTVLMKLKGDLTEIDKEALQKKAEDIDYNVLSDHGLLRRFHQEFAGGNAFEIKQCTIDGEKYYELSAEFAYEFYMRFKYTGNWRNEILEKYSYWTRDEAIQIFEEAGFTDIRAEPEWNAYMLHHWIQPEIGLFRKDEQEKLVPISFPPTHMTISGKKDVRATPKSAEVIANPARFTRALEAFDVRQLDALISIDLEHKEVRVRGKTHPVRSLPIVGSKKLVFQGEQDGTVLKVVRLDIFNRLSAIIDIQRIIEREPILDEYGVKHCRILGMDQEGLPHLCFTQEALPKGSVPVTDLVTQGTLPEGVVEQLCEYVNAFELRKRFQLDTNPFNWFLDPGGALVYVDGKVYSYQEDWAFTRIGLHQWTDPSYIQEGRFAMAAIPTQDTVQKKLQEFGNPKLVTWRRYLDPRLFS